MCLSTPAMPKTARAVLCFHEVLEAQTQVFHVLFRAGGLAGSCTETEGAGTEAGDSPKGWT